MDSVKLDNWVHRDVPFPWFRSLAHEETLRLRERLAHALNLPSTTSPLMLATTACNTIAQAPRSTTHAAGFSLKDTLTSMGITPLPLVYLNWYRFDRIDEMRFDDVNRYFDDLWYPHSDDLDIFDDTLSWLLSIHHTGALGCRRLTAAGPH